MIFTKYDWNRLPEPAKNSLQVLRGLRDRLAEDVVRELHYLVGDRTDDYGNDVESVMEQLLAYRDYSWSCRWLRRIGEVEGLDLLCVIVLRIARLEREAAQVGKEEWGRELLEA